eukprot:TRINITY_DN8217_c0_g1_i1.p1 TRINITY_DN8217_c0_g1~~TRINITY_DN8217_c0_g1_i1.p1  ORF type:complete len:519 (-),score=188.91 TRINITY_DN8217_c0_g1_i1:326-1882(-)
MSELRNRSQVDDEEHEVLIEPSDEDVEIKKGGKSGVAGDERNILVLLFLYILQGIPLGLAAAIPLILTNRNVSYKQQAEFSFAFWPFSVKLLWAPIVDSCFLSSFGRRKTWLVPVQYLIGITMFVLSYNVDYYLGDGTELSTPNISMLTAMFFFLNFLAATQDIAVDGWALTMLQRHNVGYASTCNSVGQTAGYFLGYVFFMALESYGLVTLPGFLQFWALIFMIATTLVAVLKSEAGTEVSASSSDEPDLGVVQTYKLLFDIIRLSVMPTTIAMLLTAKVGFAAADAATGLKLVEAGVPKDKLAMLAIPMMPLQIILPWIISKYTAGPRPMDVFVKAIPVRLVLCLVMAGLVYITPTFKEEDGSFPFHYYCLVVGIYAVYQVTLYSMFVSIMAFFAKVSDPAVGGTYMTLLNTVTNLGGNWPSTLALWMVDPLTTKQCMNSNSTLTTINTCTETTEVELCTSTGGSCDVQVDGYYIECGICFVVGMAWLLIWGYRTINKLTDAPDSDWMVVKSKQKQ